MFVQIIKEDYILYLVKDMAIVHFILIASIGYVFCQNIDSELHTQNYINSQQVLDDMIESYNLSSYVRTAPLPCFTLESDTILHAISYLDNGATSHTVNGTHACPLGSLVFWSKYDNKLKAPPILFDVDVEGTLNNVSYLCGYDSQFPYEMMLNDYSSNLPIILKNYEKLADNKEFLLNFYETRKQNNLHNIGLELKHIICKFYCPEEPTKIEYTCEHDAKRLMSKIKTIQ